jgi:c-di-GMP-binding flagellar brake protein YcgR
VLDIDDATDHGATAARLRYLQPGLALRLSSLGDGIGGYACAVVEVDAQIIWVDLPIRRDGMLDLEVGQLVSVRFDRPGDAAYLFDTAVSEVRHDDRAPFGLARPVTIDRRSHRREARLPMVLDAAFDLEDGPGGTGKVVDLSAGGVGLVCECELGVASTVRVRLDLPGPEGEVPLEAPAVVRSATLYGRTPGGSTLHHHGLAFVEDDEALREQVLAAVIWNLTRNPSVL